MKLPFVFLGCAACLISSGCSQLLGRAADAAGATVEHGNVAFDVSPDGKSIVFSSADGDLYVLHLTKCDVTRLTWSAIWESTPTFSPDGKSIAYAARPKNGTSAHLWTMRLKNRVAMQLTFGDSSSDASPSYSSDGRQIVFVRGYRIRPYSMGGMTVDHWDVCLIQSKGGAVRRITNSSYYFAGRPHFLPAKNQILYDAIGTYPNTTQYLMRVDAKTGRRKNITPKPKSGFSGAVMGTDADVSKDGKKLAFLSDRRRNYAYDIWVMNTNGSGAKPLGAVKNWTYNQHPVFAPDGKTVFFLAGTEDNAYSRPIFSLYKIKIGAAPQRIAGSGLFTAPSKWKPGT